MKTLLMCGQCQQELGHPSFEPIFADYFDDGVAHIECSKGHKSSILIQSLKFEVLLESGANAFLAGFTVEACATFSAALERFYEFSLRVIALARGVSKDLSSRFGEQIHQVVRQDLRAKAKTAKGMARGTSSSAMLFKIANANNPETFAAALEEYKKAGVLINGAIPQLRALSELIKIQSK